MPKLKINVVIPLTQDFQLIHNTVDTIEATRSTALYDAAYEGLQQIKDHDGIAIEVLLTDGQDNASLKNWQDVADEAAAFDIPIFVIGLGDVLVDTLQLLADASNGEFFFTENANSLDSIYSQISKKILSFYDLRYQSINFNAIDRLRDVRLSFHGEENRVSSDTSDFYLPQEVVTYLEEKETKRRYLLYGGIIVALAVSGAIFVSFRRRKKSSERPKIIKAFPNPTTGLINIHHNATEGHISIYNTRGNAVLRHTIQGLKEQLDLSSCPKGTLIVRLESTSGVSESVQIVFR